MICICNTLEAGHYRIHAISAHGSIDWNRRGNQILYICQTSHPLHHKMIHKTLQPLLLLLSLLYFFRFPLSFNILFFIIMLAHYVFRSRISLCMCCVSKFVSLNRPLLRSHHLTPPHSCTLNQPHT